jgi:assimilatory nitrate reductase catalytic subunit
MTLHLTNPVIKTACPYCGVGCGVKAKPDGKGGANIAGDEDHPANFGRLCSKGSALGETLSLDDRLLHPMLRSKDGGYQRVSWDDALDHLAEGLTRISMHHGAEAIAFYLSGQLLTEDYYAANKLAKGFIGTPHVDTNSRLCMSSSVAGHRRAFGADLVPGQYADLDEADLIVLVGSNTAWCHPVLFQRMVKNRRERGAKLIVMDPRRTATAEEADLFLPLRPGSDAVLFAALLVHLDDHGLSDKAAIAAHTEGYAATLEAARQLAPSIEAVAKATDLPQEDIKSFLKLWSETEKTVTAWSQGVNQSDAGTDKVNAIINCHLAANRIGKPGMGPFSLTGQPNAMGGREVGGLANMLAAHMNYNESDRDRVRRFWQAPNLARQEGLKAVAMMDAIGKEHIKALWVMATNPAVSLPETARMRAALQTLDLFVVSDVVLSNDTIACEPDLILPAAAWGEKDGTVTNSERRMSRQRAFLPLPGEARPDWWIIAETAKRLGFDEAFSWSGPADVFREHAALSAFENDGNRFFDLSGLVSINDQAYDNLTPVVWPVRRHLPIKTRLFGDGHYATSDRRARFIPIGKPPAARNGANTLRLNTGRVRDQWHTMTRTGKSARLSEHVAAPFAAFHPNDAAHLMLNEGGFVELFNRHGSAVFAVLLDKGQRQGEIFVPIHWSQTNSSSTIGRLVDARVDPVSGQPDLKASEVEARVADFTHHGFRLSHELLQEPSGSVWSRRIVKSGFCTVFATNDPQGWRDETADAVLDDLARGAFRSMRASADGAISMTVCEPFTSPLALAGMIELFEAGLAPDEQSLAALAGLPVSAGHTASPVICACHGVRQQAIIDHAQSMEKCSVSDIGDALKAGTNCGSCQPEIRKILSGLLARA